MNILDKIRSYKKFYWNVISLDTFLLSWESLSQLHMHLVLLHLLDIYKIEKFKIS